MRRPQPPVRQTDSLPVVGARCHGPFKLESWLLCSSLLNDATAAPARPRASAAQTPSLPSTAHDWAEFGSHNRCDLDRDSV